MPIVFLLCNYNSNGLASLFCFMVYPSDIARMEIKHWEGCSITPFYLPVPVYFHPPVVRFWRLIRECWQWDHPIDFVQAWKPRKYPMSSSLSEPENDASGYMFFAHRKSRSLVCHRLIDSNDVEVDSLKIIFTLLVSILICTGLKASEPLWRRAPPTVRSRDSPIEDGVAYRYGTR